MTELEEQLNNLGVATDVQEELKKLMAKAKEKLNVSNKDVLAKFNEEVERMKKKLPNASPEIQKARAWAQLRSFYKTELASPAKYFEGVVLGVWEPFDMVARDRVAALEIWKENPEDAVAKGWTDDDGNPLDRREAYASGKVNPDFGKPLPKQRLIQNVWGICKEKNTEGEWKKFMMTLGEALAGKIETPINQPVVFRGNPANKQDRPGYLLLNPYARLTFDIQKVDDFSLDAVLGLECLKDVHAELGSFEQWHEDHKENPRRVFMAEADVSYVSQPTERGTIRLVLDDASLPMNVGNITAWVPPHLVEMIDFDQGSRLVVNGTTNVVQREGEERKQFMLALNGLYAPPELKVKPDEIPGQQHLDAQQVE